MDITPSVVDLEAAWFLVYTSGSLMTPKEETRLKNTPISINAAMMISAVTLIFDDDSLLQEFRESYCSDERKNSQQQDDIKVGTCRKQH